ncbi:predicted protein [Fibroporia radiculosa]|uniref:Uncharacterized protein n=1 Tax=Fibroporia radiculosa TaxID=599839 RepID=J4GBH8_9APHY|nr:predicted protein [Fibroporia radiculosa]
MEVEAEMQHSITAVSGRKKGTGRAL